MKTNDYIPFHTPSIGEEEITEVVATLRSGWLTTGPRTAQFEREFAEYVQSPYAQAVNSCTAGLHLALVGLGLGKGDEVITTPLTFCATVNTILHTGATPVLADVDEDGNLDPDAVEARLTERTRAIVPVHLGGKPCRMDRLWALAKARGLWVVEDAAHAVGSHYRGRPIGASLDENGPHSDAVAFSFYATKNLTTGEGGMVVTPHQKLYQRMKCLCLHGISRDAWDRYSARGSWAYQVLECGFKYNLSDLQSAIGLHQLRKLEGFIARRTELAALYTRLLDGVDEIRLPTDAAYCRHSWHLYAVRLNLDLLTIDRAQWMQELAARGIGASVHFIPIPLHPFFADYQALEHNRCERAIAQYQGTVSLPLYPAMTEAQVRRTVDAIKEIAWRSKKSLLAGVGA